MLSNSVLCEVVHHCFSLVDTLHHSADLTSCMLPIQCFLLVVSELESLCVCVLTHPIHVCVLTHPIYQLIYLFNLKPRGSH